MNKAILVSSFVLLLLAGCESYVVPGDKANLSKLAPASIQEGFSTKPSNPYPASVVAVRVQAPSYGNYRLNRGAGVYGGGAFSVVTTREVESESDLSKVMSLPGVERVIGLNRLLLPERLDGLQQLQEAASQLKADLIFVYTFDTIFLDVNKSKVLSTISLGFSPNKKLRASTTASALLVDTRTGYIYSAYEASASEEKSASVWNTQDKADEARLNTEKMAFAKLMQSVVASWPDMRSMTSTETVTAPTDSSESTNDFWD